LGGFIGAQRSDGEPGLAGKTSGAAGRETNVDETKELETLNLSMKKMWGNDKH